MPARRRAYADIVRAWDFDDIVVEHYHYAPGPAGVMTAHAHPEYQLGVSLDTPGEYTYRRARHPVPARSISILHPDEPHAARDVIAREKSAKFWVLYLKPSFMREAARSRGTVFFAEPVATDSRLFRHLADLFPRLVSATSRIERETHLAAALRHLLGHARLLRDDPCETASRRRLERVREQLEDEPGNPALADLAREAGLSPWRFCREFRARFGQPPHAYLLHARIRRAKRLLLAGAPLADTALHCGFTDQSHFTRHFRRLVDVTPARYQAGGGVASR